MRAPTIITTVLLLWFCSTLAASQTSQFNKEQFKQQVLNVLHLKLLDKYEEMTKKVTEEFPQHLEGYLEKRINKLESELLQISNFDQLLWEFKDLGVSSENPNISKAFRSVAKDLIAFTKTKGPITRTEIEGYLSRWWKPVATYVMDKESVSIISELNNLMSKARGRLKALQEIQSTPDLSEVLLTKKLKDYGLPTNLLDKIKPLEMVLRSTWRELPDPVGNFNILSTAFSSENPSDKIAVLFTLGAKYSDKIPIIGQFVEPMFQLAGEMLNSTKAIGQLLNQNFNQGCIYTDGQYNVQEDQRAKLFLKTFPGVEVCPLYFSPEQAKSKKKWTPQSTVQIPTVYKSTYFDIEKGNNLYFYLDGNWKKAKQSPSHRGESDIKSIVAWLRSNGLAEKAQDANLVYNIYNNSPGFQEFQSRAEQKINKLKTLLFQSPGVFNAIRYSDCDKDEMENWFQTKTGIRNLEKFFPSDYTLIWDEYMDPYSKLWEDLLVNFQMSEYSRFLKQPKRPVFHQGVRPMVELESIIENLDFAMIRISGRILNADLSPAKGIRVKLDRQDKIYKGHSECQKEYADAKGNFDFFYVTTGMQKESRFLIAKNIDDQVVEVKIGIDPIVEQQYYTLITFPLDCPQGYKWNSKTLICEAIKTENAPPKPKEGPPETDPDSIGVEQPPPTSGDSLKVDEPGEEPRDSNMVRNDQPPKNYCDAFANTIPVKDAKSGGWACDCKVGWVWNLAGTACITKQESLVERADCSAFPNTQAKWSNAEGGVICDCKPGFRFNPEGKCVPTEAKAEELADCSEYENTKPKWSDADGGIVCDCIPGYTWKKDFSGCEKVNHDALCAQEYPGSIAKFNKKEGTYFCECPKGYEWNKTETACVLTEAYALARADCSSIPNSNPKYNRRTQEVSCECKPGFKWNASFTRCEKDPEFDQAKNDLIDALLEMGNGGGIGEQEGTHDSQDNPVVPSEDQHQGECGVPYNGSGTNTPQQYSFQAEFGAKTYNLTYNLYDVKDRIHVYLNGRKVFDSQCSGGSGSQEILTNGMAGILKVIIDPRCDGTSNTAWDFVLKCSN